ncbi:hypothetical protein CLOM_g5990 [Closterium sp. NIES-68]|nr:hypothetical protein CLOM_g5990 [Closterium sp. NIES-68]GJP80053.1 hypothetical protein CLOP_g10289 [Closterium sp. NIES-67]
MLHPALRHSILSSTSDNKSSSRTPTNHIDISRSPLPSLVPLITSAAGASYKGEALPVLLLSSFPSSSMSVTALPIHGLEQYGRMNGGQPSPSHSVSASAAAAAAAASILLNSSGPLPSYMSSPRTNAGAGAAAAASAAGAPGSSNSSGSVESSTLPFCHTWDDAAPGSLAARLLSSSTEELFDVPGDDCIPLPAAGDATLRPSADQQHLSLAGTGDSESWQPVDGGGHAALIMSGELPRLAGLHAQQLESSSVDFHQMSGGRPLQRLLSQSSIGSNCSGSFHHAAYSVPFLSDSGCAAGPGGSGADGLSATPTGLAAYLLSAPLEALFDVPEEEDPAGISASGAETAGGEQGANGLRLDPLAIQRGNTPPLPPRQLSGLLSPQPASSAAASDAYVNYPGPIFSAPLGAMPPARSKYQRQVSGNSMPRQIKRVFSCNDAPQDQAAQGAYSTDVVPLSAQEAYYAGSPRRDTAAAGAAGDAAGAGACGVVRSRSTNSAPGGGIGGCGGWFRASGSPAGGASSARQIVAAPSGQSLGKYGYAAQQSHHHHHHHPNQHQFPGGAFADVDPSSASSGAGCASFLRPSTGSTSSSTGSDNSSGSDSGSNVSPWQIVGAMAGAASGGSVSVSASGSFEEVSPHSGALSRHRTTGSLEFARSCSGNYGGATLLSPQQQQQQKYLQFGGASIGSSAGSGSFSAIGGGLGGPGGQGGSGGGPERWVMAPMGPVLTPIEQSPVTSDRYNPSVASVAMANGSASPLSQRSTPVASAVFPCGSGDTDEAVADGTPQQVMLQQQLQQQMAMMMMMQGGPAAATSAGATAAAAAAAMQPSQSKERAMVKASSYNQLHTYKPHHHHHHHQHQHLYSNMHHHQRNLSGASPCARGVAAGSGSGPGSVVSEADVWGLEEEMRQLEADMARLQADPARLAQLSAQDKHRVHAAAAEIESMRACLTRRSPSLLMFDASPGARPVAGGSYHGGGGAGLALGVATKKGGLLVAGDLDGM